MAFKVTTFVDSKSGGISFTRGRINEKHKKFAEKEAATTIVCLTSYLQRSSLRSLFRMLQILHTQRKLRQSSFFKALQIP